MWRVDLKCPRCTEPPRSLQWKRLYTRVRLVLDVRTIITWLLSTTFVVLQGYIHSLGCPATSAALSRYKGPISSRVRGFPSPSSFSRQQFYFHSKKNSMSEEWMRKCTSYLSRCERHRRSHEKHPNGKMVSCSLFPRRVQSARSSNGNSYVCLWDYLKG